MFVNSLKLYHINFTLKQRKILVIFLFEVGFLAASKRGNTILQCLPTLGTNPITFAYVRTSLTLYSTWILMSTYPEYSRGITATSKMNITLVVKIWETGIVYSESIKYLKLSSSTFLQLCWGRLLVLEHMHI